MSNFATYPFEASLQTLYWSRLCDSNRRRLLTPEDLQEFGFHKLPQNSILFICDLDETLSVQFFLQAIEIGVIPVFLPKSWSHERIHKAIIQYPGSHLWKDGQLIISKSPELRAEYEKCYGVFSSGSTGIPKISFLSVDGAIQNAKAHALSLEINQDSIVLKILPLDHAFGVIAYIWTPLIMKCKIAFISDFSGWSSLPHHYLNKAVLHLTPTWSRLLLKTSSQFTKSPEIISIGSGPISFSELNELSSLTGAKIFITYGLTEAGPRVTTGLFESVNYVPGCIGKPLNGISLAVRNTTEEINFVGQGQLLIQSPSIKMNLREHEMFQDYLLTSDDVELRSDNTVILKNRHRTKFKFREFLIDLDDLKIQNEITLAAIVWVENYTAKWLLVVIGSERATLTENHLNKKLDLRLQPEEILWLEQAPLTSLGKLDLNQILIQQSMKMDHSYEFYFTT